MLLISHYLKDKRKVIIGYVLIIACFLAVCALYQLGSLAKVIYAAVIIGFVGVCYGIYDFWQYSRHYNALCRLSGQRNEGEVFSLDDLPPAADSLQEEYQNRLREMQEALQRNLSTQRQKESEMMDYYLMWAHQIKTPIAAMKLLIGNEPGNNFLMEKELFKIESYVEMVLHYLRLESPSSDLLLKKYDVYTMVKNTVKKYSLLFIEGRISLNLQEFRKEIITDEKWFTFVLEQLLSNAIKYTPAGEIAIYLEGEQLFIRDTGIGISEEDLPRIFERGFTGYNGRMDKKSTGIGLYLSRQVTDRLGILLTISSGQGQGTQVCLDFAGLTKM